MNKAKDRAVEVARPVPSNLDIIESQKQFAQLLPSRMGLKQKNVREFILNELLPISLAIQNGTLDAFDVATRTLETDISSEGVQQTMKALVIDSLNIRLLSFVTKIAELDISEARLLLASYLLRTNTALGGGQNVIEQIMSSLRELPIVQRQEEERQLPLREVPGVQERGQRSRSLRAKARARREAEAEDARRDLGKGRGNRRVRAG